MSIDGCYAAVLASTTLIRALREDGARTGRPPDRSSDDGGPTGRGSKGRVAPDRRYGLEPLARTLAESFFNSRSM